MAVTTGRTYPFVITALGQALFPDKTHFSQELQAYFSEMLVEHLAKGLPPSTVALGASLSEFVPRSIRESTPEWLEKSHARWLNQLRPQIFAAMEAFLLNGGYEERLAIQSGLFAELLGSGIQISGLTVLRDALSVSGHWRDEFVLWVERGRPRGVLFVTGPSYDKTRATLAMGSAGFGKDQINKVLGHFG